MKAIVVPVKDPANSKTRLSGLLAAETRQRLASVMFADVARALSGVRRADGIFIVTSYIPALERARKLGFDVLLEAAQESESASVDWASGELEARGFDEVMRLPADIPLVTAEDIEGLLGLEIQRPGALMVPSREGTGTNSLLRTPPTLFPSHFGPDSLRLHSGEAERLGIKPAIVDNKRIALDIDEPEDLIALVEYGGASETLGFVLESGVANAVISARSNSR